MAVQNVDYVYGSAKVVPMKLVIQKGKAYG